MGEHGEMGENGALLVLGPGLLGGSVALAARGRWPGEIRMWGRREEVLEEALAGGVADRVGVELGGLVEGVGLAVLATPVGVMGRLAGELAALVGPVEAGGRLVLTDVGSVKEVVLREVGSAVAGSGVEFVGSHPMAGSEKAGLGAARADLFVGARCLMTPAGGAGGVAAGQVRAFWEMLGCEVIEMGAREHDQAVGRASHLPHLAAAALVRAALGGEGGALAARCAGPGFRDSTRVALGDAGLWAGILLENREAVLGRIVALGDELERAGELLRAGDEEGLRDYLEEARKEKMRVV
jgi:prephenate dehydrogenase